MIKAYKQKNGKFTVTSDKITPLIRKQKSLERRGAKFDSSIRGFRDVPADWVKRLEAEKMHKVTVAAFCHDQRRLMEVSNFALTVGKVQVRCSVCKKTSVLGTTIVATHGEVTDIEIGQFSGV